MVANMFNCKVGNLLHDVFMEQVDCMYTQWLRLSVANTANNEILQGPCGNIKLYMVQNEVGCVYSFACRMTNLLCLPPWVSKNMFMLRKWRSVQQA